MLHIGNGCGATYYHKDLNDNNVRRRLQSEHIGYIYYRHITASLQSVQHLTTSWNIVDIFKVQLGFLFVNELQV